MGRIERLREAHNNLVHSKYRMTREQSIWDHADHSSEPIVVRKARALELILRETPAVILDDELIVGLRTLYSPLEDEGEKEDNSVYPECVEATRGIPVITGGGD